MLYVLVYRMYVDPVIFFHGCGHFLRLSREFSLLVACMFSPATGISLFSLVAGTFSIVAGSIHSRNVHREIQAFSP